MIIYTVIILFSLKNHFIIYIIRFFHGYFFHCFLQFGLHQNVCNILYIKWLKMQVLIKRFRYERQTFQGDIYFVYSIIIYVPISIWKPGNYRLYIWIFPWKRTKPECLNCVRMETVCILFYFYFVRRATQR